MAPADRFPWSGPLPCPESHRSSLHSSKGALVVKIKDGEGVSEPSVRPRTVGGVSNPPPSSGSPRSGVNRDGGPRSLCFQSPGLPQ